MDNSRGWIIVGVLMSGFIAAVLLDDPANDELYSKMREQKIQRQELRKSRGECHVPHCHTNRRTDRHIDRHTGCHCVIGDDDQLTADVTTLATWGDSDSSSDSSTSSDDDGDGEATPNEQEIEDDGMLYFCLICCNPTSWMDVGRYCHCVE